MSLPEYSDKATERQARLRKFRDLAEPILSLSPDYAKCDGFGAGAPTVVPGYGAERRQPLRRGREQPDNVKDRR